MLKKIALGTVVLATLVAGGFYAVTRMKEDDPLASDSERPINVTEPDV